MTVIDFLILIRVLLAIAQISAAVCVVALVIYIVELIRERKGKKK